MTSTAARAGRHVALTVLAFTVALAAETVAAQPPPPPPPSTPVPFTAPAGPRDAVKGREGTARVQGTVVSSDGQPIKRATVTLSGGAPGDPQRAATTDAEGRFAFQHVPSGRFTLLARSVGYVATGRGAKRPGGPSRPLEIGDGAVLDNANITLARGCAFAGRVVDEYGEPVSGVMVRPMKYRFTGGRRQLAPVAAFPETTDDLGQFRTYGLPAGEYYVAATIMPTFTNGDSSATSGYAPTFYPGTASPTEATAVGCLAGQEVTGIDFALNVVPTFRVSGTLRDSAGKAPASAMVTLMPWEPGPGLVGVGVGNTGMVQPDGTFTIGDVVPGQYSIRASTAGPSSGEIAVAPLTVTRNVTGLSITTARTGVVTGRVVADTGLSFNIPLAQVSVYATPANPAAPRMSSGSPRVTAEGTFELSGLDGQWMFRASAPGWWLKAVRLNGEDITDRPVALHANTDVAGLEVVLTTRTTSVSGTAADPQGKMLHDYVLLLFPQDTTKWHWNSRFLATGRPDQHGRFKLNNVPPGDYFVAAVREVEAEEWTDPEVLARLKGRATRLTLAEGDHKTVDVPLLEEEKR
jgi:hypothetical protein